MQLGRRDFLKFLGLAPVALVAGAASARASGWVTGLAARSTDPASQIGPWSVRNSDGSYTTVTTRSWDPGGRDPSPSARLEQLQRELTQKLNDGIDDYTRIRRAGK